MCTLIQQFAHWLEIDEAAVMTPMMRKVMMETIPIVAKNTDKMNMPLEGL